MTYPTHPQLFVLLAFWKNMDLFSFGYLFWAHYSTALELKACNGIGNINSLIDEKEQVVQPISIIKVKAFG